MDPVSVSSVRPLRRGDLPRLAELRHWYLAETARLEPRLKLTAEARERIVQAANAWIAQEERVVLVVDDVPAGKDPLPGLDPAAAPSIVGYATGVATVWPPVWKTQRVGEVSEVFVVPDHRGKGHGRALLDAVVHALVRLGAEVLRAPVPVKNDGSEALFHARGFEPMLRVYEKPGDEKPGDEA